MASTSSLKVDVVIPIWNQPEVTRRCLDSILQSGGEPLRLILVDNGSTTETKELLEKFAASGRIPVKLIRNEENLGFVKGTNQGIRAGGAEWVCLLNNDTVVTPGWLAEMIRVAEADPANGLVNPSSNSLGSVAGGLSPAAYAETLKPLSGQWVDLPKALGFCLLAKRSLLDRIGLLDETFGMGNFEDDDLSNRARQAGLRCVRATAAYVHHEEKTSFRDLPGWKQGFQENRKKFEKRWGRPLRILWGPGPSNGGFPKEAALQLSREGHWLCFVRAAASLPPEVPTQAQTSFLGLPENGWIPRATLWLLVRRKKPFDLVISYNRPWSGWVRRLGMLHRAQVLENPTAQAILEKCRELSNV